MIMPDVPALPFEVLSNTWFHTSGAAGLKSGQSNHQETLPFWRNFIRARSTK
jgi:hypothetical protein